MEGGGEDSTRYVSLISTGWQANKTACSQVDLKDLPQGSTVPGGPHFLVFASYSYPIEVGLEDTVLLAWQSTHFN
jgi:hypothetical protein